MPAATGPTARHVLCLLLALTALTSPGAGGTSDDHESLFDRFYTTGLDTGSAYQVRDLSIQRDNMTLVLETGTVFLMQPIDGEITGLAFIGEGVARMTPPNRTESYMLQREYGAARLDEPFGEAVIRFCDDTEELILRHGTPVAPAGAERAAEIFRERNGWLNGRRSLALEARYLELRLSGLAGLDYFVAEFRSARHGWLTFYHDPQSYRENGLFASRTLGARGRRYTVPWSVWHRAADYGPQGHYLRLPARDGPRLLRIRHQEMQINLEDTRTVKWEARLLIEPRAAGLRALLFDLVTNASSGSDWDDDSFHPVEVEAVSDDSGAPIPFMHRKDSLLVVMPRPLQPESPFSLVVRGTAEVIAQLTAESFGLLQAAWYPQYGFLGGRSSFHWTVRVPRPFLISGSGRFVRQFEDPERNQNGLEMREDRPVHFPWAIFGRFQEAAETYVNETTGRPVRMTIHSFPIMTIAGGGHGTLDLRAPPGKVDAFLAEGKEILKLYEHLYGPYPYEELHIAQMAPTLGFAQAPQGFVQLTGQAFMSQAALEDDSVHGLFAHEIAHQWWGHRVGWASPDDEWLSESFSEYAAGIFVEAYQGAKRFQRTLEEWRTAAKHSDREAPIAAANRLRGPDAELHRTNLLYSKGAYVLHMLRVQLDDVKYAEVMRSILDSYDHDDISTELFLKEVNRVTGSDYTYFFDQWFWDVGIPTFRYSWRSEKRQDGKYLVTIHVSQQDRERLKRVLMPVHLHFKRGESVPQYRPVVEAEQDIRFLLDVEPRDVTLDDDRALLAEYVKAN
jgi:hypothetical protein